MLERKRQQGFALMAAIFILIVLSGMAIYMVSISGVQQQTSTLAIDSAKATYAAESGIEIAAYRALQLGSCTGSVLQIGRFDVAISCSASSHTEQGQTFSVYRIEARAEAGTYGGLGYASRRMGAAVTDAP
jgi:MSHA biogenesis protein MshP